MAKQENKRKRDERDARFQAAVDLIGRTGAAEFQIRYSDDETPTVWMAIARWGDRWEAAGALGPLSALFRLCDEVLDGGTCQHCKRITGFEPSMERMPLDSVVCWYQWDPSTKSFARGCA